MPGVTKGCSIVLSVNVGNGSITGEGSIVGIGVSKGPGDKVSGGVKLGEGVELGSGVILGAGVELGTGVSSNGVLSLIFCALALEINKGVRPDSNWKKTREAIINLKPE
jgi:NDP-sugar pyrophosphorylase family protein